MHTFMYVCDVDLYVCVSNLSVLFMAVYLDAL